MSDEDLFAALLEAETAGSQPPSRVINVAAAARQARRHRRWRRAGGIASAATAVLAVILAVSSLGGPPAPPPVQPAPPPSPTAEPTPARFSPLRITVQWGFVPESLPSRHTRLTPTAQDVEVAEPADSTVTGARTTAFIARVYAAGIVPALTAHGPKLGTWPPAGSVDGPTIHGGPSWWAAGKVLTWRWAPDAWAAVYTFQVPETMPVEKETVVHIASTLRTGLDLPVRAPFTAVAPPPAVHLESTTITTTRGEEGVALTYSDAAPDGSAPGSHLLVLEVFRHTREPGEDEHERLTNGYSAAIHFDDGFEIKMQLFGEKGLDLLGGHDATLALVRAIEIVPNASDVSQWTDKPIRA